MGAGRKSKYDKNTFPLLAENLARKGFKDEEIAKSLGIALGTYYDFKNKFPEFSEAIKRGKKPVDIEVENALLKRALGYDFEEKTTEIEIGADGQAKPARIKTIKKHYAGDVAAQFIWLKNRMPKEWRDKREFEVQEMKLPEIKIEVSTPEMSETMKKALELINSKNEIK